MLAPSKVCAADVAREVTTCSSRHGYVWLHAGFPGKAICAIPKCLRLARGPRASLLAVTVRGRNQASMSRPFDRQRDGQRWSTRDDRGEDQTF